MGPYETFRDPVVDDTRGRYEADASACYFVVRQRFRYNSTKAGLRPPGIRVICGHQSARTPTGWENEESQMEWEAEFIELILEEAANDHGMEPPSTGAITSETPAG